MFFLARGSPHWHACYGSSQLSRGTPSGGVSQEWISKELSRERKTNLSWPKLSCDRAFNLTLFTELQLATKAGETDNYNKPVSFAFRNTPFSHNQDKNGSMQVHSDRSRSPIRAGSCRSRQGIAVRENDRSRMAAGEIVRLISKKNENRCRNTQSNVVDRPCNCNAESRSSEAFRNCRRREERTVRRLKWEEWLDKLCTIYLCLQFDTNLLDTHLACLTGDNVFEMREDIFYNNNYSFFLIYSEDAG